MAAQTETTAIVVSEPAPLVTHSTSPSAAIEGDFDKSDEKLPRLQIVQGSGELAKLFNVGTLLYANEILFPPDAPNVAPSLLRFVPVGLRKQFRENLTEEEQAAGALPRLCNTYQEMIDLGGSTEWVGGEKPAWSPSAQVFMLLEQPKDISHPGFCLDIGGKVYGPAVYFASSTAYRTLALPIFNATKIQLRGNISKRFWAVRVVKKPGKKFTVFAPEARLLTEDCSTELVELCTSFVGAKVPVEA